MKVFIIILNYNGGRAVIECLQSVSQLADEKEGFDLSVVVVDNGSTDGSALAVRNKFTNVVLIENDKNLGFAAGNNVGLRYGLENGADWLMLLNNDTEIAKKAVVRLIEVGRKKRKAGVLSPKIYFAPGYEFHRQRYQKKDQGKVIWYAGGVIDWKNMLAFHHGVDEVDRGQHEQMTETDFVTGCAMMIRRKVFEKIGLLDERYFLYYEDTDFCQRASQAGFKILFVPQAKVWHKNLGTGRMGTELQDYYLTRNRLLFGLRWAPRRTKLALLKESLRILLLGRPWQKKGLLDFYLRRFGKGSYEA